MTVFQGAQPVTPTSQGAVVLDGVCVLPTKLPGQANLSVLLGTGCFHKIPGWLAEVSCVCTSSLCGHTLLFISDLRR